MMTVAANTSLVSSNRLEGIQFVGGSQYAGSGQALIDIGAVEQPVGYACQTETEPPSLTFTLRQQAAGPMTVGLRVDDHCGTWTTFVGSGS